MNMSIVNKMLTAIRGGLQEASQAIVDSQALRILDQEVRDSAEELKANKDNLTAMMAKHRVSKEKVERLKTEIREHEGYAVKALEQKEEKLALEIAEKVAELENELELEELTCESCAENENSLRSLVKQTEREIKRLKQQIDTVKATESVQRAQTAVSRRHSGANSRLTTAKESLERIKAKQQEKSARMDAAEEQSEPAQESPLEDKLEAAGIISRGPNADQVLERLQKTKSTRRKKKS